MQLPPFDLWIEPQQALGRRRGRCCEPCLVNSRDTRPRDCVAILGLDGPRVEPARGDRPAARRAASASSKSSDLLRVDDADALLELEELEKRLRQLEDGALPGSAIQTGALCIARARAALRAANDAAPWSRGRSTADGHGGRRAYRAATPRPAGAMTTGNVEGSPAGRRGWHRSLSGSAAAEDRAAEEPRRSALLQPNAHRRARPWNRDPVARPRILQGQFPREKRGGAAGSRCERGATGRERSSPRPRGKSGGG